jgi:hypothetical protein
MPDDAYMRLAQTPRARVAEGRVRWRGHREVVSALLDAHAEADGDWSFITGEMAWQLAEEGWRPKPPQPVAAIADALGRLSEWFLAGMELAERNVTPHRAPDGLDSGHSGLS